MKDDVTAAEKMRRNQVLLDDQDVRGQRLNEACIGQIQEVLAEGVSLRNEERWAGRSPGNKIVIFKHEPPIVAGDLVPVRITGAKPQALYGEVARARPEPSAEPVCGTNHARGPGRAGATTTAL